MAPQVLFRVIYGTPEPEPWQAERVTIRPAVLHEYRRQRVKHADFPAIVPRPSTTVRGAFITGLTDEDVACLDMFEGVMYKRQKVKVKLLKDVKLGDNIPDSKLAKAEGEEVEAETYVWRWPVEDLEDKEWDFEHFKKRKLKAWAGMVTDPNTSVDEGFADVDAYCAAVATSTRGGLSGGRGTGGRGSDGGGTANRSMPDRETARRGTGGQPMEGRGGSVKGTTQRGVGSQAPRGRGQGGGVSMKD